MSVMILSIRRRVTFERADDFALGEYVLSCNGLQGGIAPGAPPQSQGRDTERRNCISDAGLVIFWESAGSTVATGRM
jgi:hypothetical protein